MPVAKQDRRSKRIHHEEHEGHEEWKQAGLLLNFNVTSGSVVNRADYYTPQA